MQGLVINNISNNYIVECGEQQIKCNARGKFKKEEITPVVGDRVEIEIIDETKQEGVINEILERDNYIKRPKLANITQIILVVSAKMPKPDLLMLDKQLAFAHLQKIKPVIVLNKIDLNQIEEIKKIYEDIGYKVIKTNAKARRRSRRIKKNFKK